MSLYLFVVSIIIILGQEKHGVYDIPGYAAIDFGKIILFQVYNNDILSVYGEERAFDVL